jgi:hypothetical protein
MEEWRTIKEYEIYEVSNCGRVRNKNTSKVMKNTIKSGYYHVCLVKNKNRKIFKIHRLVAETFIHNLENKPEVNHKDKNKINNNKDNLEWMTRKENNIHRCNGAKIVCNKNKPILRIDKNKNYLLERYNSIELAGIWAFNNGYTKTMHNGRNAIGNCVNGLSKCAYSFKWKYENNNNDLENEIWKKVYIENTDIKEKEYFVSNLGRFKNSFGTIMDNYKVNENGYTRVYIYNKTFALHRLIALAFIENTENKKQVNHIDGNKLNNKLENLEWVSNKENQIHKYKIGLGNKTSKKIIQYDLELNEIKIFNSIMDASKELNINYSRIKNILYKKQKTTQGFMFKYLE